MKLVAGVYFIYYINEYVSFPDFLFSPIINQQAISLKFKLHLILEPPCVTIVRSHIYNSVSRSTISLTVWTYQIFFMIGVGHLCTIQMATYFMNLKCYLNSYKQPSIVQESGKQKNGKQNDGPQDVNILIPRTCQCVILYYKKEFVLQMKLRLLISYLKMSLFWTIQMGSM